MLRMIIWAIVAVLFFSLLVYNIILTSTPKGRYEVIVENIEKYNRELEKFLIDHPEFKECE